MSDTTSREAVAREIYALAEGVEQGYYGNTEMVQINLPTGEVIRQVRVTVQEVTDHMIRDEGYAMIQDEGIPPEGLDDDEIERRAELFWKAQNPGKASPQEARRYLHDDGE